MAKAVIQANIQTSNGVISVAPNASIAIRDADSGSLVSLWSDRDGVSSITNPTQADENGDFKVYATSGRVNITATHGGFSKVWSDVVASDVYGGVNTPNAALNPNFDIAQRGASFVSPASGAYDLDGWLNSNTSAAAITVIQGTGPTTGSYSRQVTVTTADTSIAAGDVLADQHRITGYDIIDYDLTDNTFTVSFWAKFPLTGIHCVALRNSGADRSYVHEITVAAADTWAEYQFTVDGGLTTAGTWNYTTGIGLNLYIVHACGSTYQTATTDQWVTGNYQATANQVNDAATVSNVWAIAKVKINKGTQPTNAAYNKPEMWFRCQQRYPELLGYSDGVLASFGSTTAAYAKMSLAVEPLVPITGISVSATTDFTLYATASTSSFSSIAFQHAGPRSVGIAITASAPLAGAAAGYCGSFIGNATIGAKIFGLGAEI